MRLAALCCGLFIFIASICWADARAGEYRVWPMLINIEAEPGNSYPFQFNVLAVKSGTISVYLNEVEQLATGHVQFIPTEKSQHLTLTQTKASLDDGETYIVHGAVTVPRKASGSRLYALLIEDDDPRKNTGMQIKVRYAVVIDVAIKGRKSRVKTRLSNLEVIDGTISAWFENLSDKKAMLKSQVIIRDNNRRLVDRQLLRTQSAIERQEDYSVVYPNSKVKVLATSDQLTGGTYNLLIQSNFNEKSLPVLRSEINYLQCTDCRSADALGVYRYAATQVCRTT